MFVSRILAKVGRLWIINGIVIFAGVKVNNGCWLRLSEALSVLRSRIKSISGSSLMIF